MLELAAMFRTELNSKRFQVYSKPIDCRLNDLNDKIDDTMDAMAVDDFAGGSAD